MPFVDCEIGPDPEQSIGPDGKIIHGCTSNHTPFSRQTNTDERMTGRFRMHTIVSTILSEVRDLVLNTKQKYTDILALDRKLRDCAIELFGGPVGDRQVRCYFESTFSPANSEWRGSICAGHIGEKRDHRINDATLFLAGHQRNV